ncbi:MAG: PepSY domain-containing protein [Pyrinomonadaceae bacterium]|nr:PepSY domain-containing protein [Pyrinomonadaceae bacterium]
MKRNKLVAFGLLVSFGLVGGVEAKNAVFQIDVNSEIVRQAPIPIEEARKIALKKAEGKIEEEFSLEEEGGKLIAYVFKIRVEKKKVMEVQVDATNGAILYAEQDTSYQ